MPVTSQLGHQARQENRGRKAASGCSPSALPRSLGYNLRALARYCRQVFGLTGEPLRPTCHSFPAFSGQCFFCDFRSCLPLRGSPGFTPGSLFITAQKLETANRQLDPSIWGMTGKLQHSWMNTSEEWKPAEAKVAGGTSRPQSLLPGVWTVSEQPDAVQHALFEPYWPRRSRIQTRSRRCRGY